MSVEATIAVEAEFSTDVWTAITADVLAAHGLTAEYGIRGQRPTDRVAQVGKMKFALDNSVGNIGAVQGYYAPANANAASGWDISTAVRLKITYDGTDYYKFLGGIALLPVTPGTKKDLTVKVAVEDWMKDASEAKVQLLPVQEDQRTDQVIDTVVSAMEAQPRATSYATAQETLPSALDDVKDGRTAVKTVLQKAVLSEFGFLMLIGDTAGGGTLKFQDRHARVKDRTVQITLTSDDIADLKFQHDKKLIFNEVRAKVFPRDESASAATLGQLDSALEIAAGATDTIRLQYRDPDLLDARLSGKDLYGAEGKNELTENTIDDDFESGIVGWTASGTGVTIAQSSDFAKADTYALKIDSGTNAAVQPRVVTNKMGSMSQGDVLYWQVWLYNEDIWQDPAEILLREWTSAPAYISTQTLQPSILHIGSWVRYSGQVTLAEATVDQVDLIIGADSAGDYSGGAVQAYIDEVYLIHDTELNFEFSASEAGDGGTLNDDLELVGSTIGGSGAEFVLKNTGSTSGYLPAGGLKVRGTAIRLYNPVERVAIDATSQTDHSEQSLSLNLAYQSDTRTGQDFADVTLAKYKDPQGWVKSVTFHANRSDALMTAALGVEPGERIALTEAVSGLSATEFFVNAVKLKIYNKGFIDCTWFVVPASTEQYWLCGTAGASEIGETTYVGF